MVSIKLGQKCYRLKNTPAYYMTVQVTAVKCFKVEASADQKTRNLFERNSWQILD